MQLGNSHNAFEYLRSKQRRDVEEFWGIALTSQLKIIDGCCLFRGTVDRCLVHPRELFRFAFRANASQIIISHNHPSGDPTPSPSDLLWTRRLIVAGEVFSIPILDHIILAGNKYHSMADQNQLITRNLDQLIDRSLGILASEETKENR